MNPNIGIITGITEQHLERFGSLEAIIHTIFELPQNMAKHGECFLNTENENVKNGYIVNQDLLVNYIDIADEHVTNVRCLDHFEGVSFEYDSHVFTTQLIGTHNIPAMVIAYKIGRKLGIESEKLVAAIAKIPYLEHRLEKIVNEKNGVCVLDDSFNGNNEGVKAIISLCKATKTNGRKIYVTP